MNDTEELTDYVAAKIKIKDYERKKIRFGYRKDLALQMLNINLQVAQFFRFMEETFCLGIGKKPETSAVENHQGGGGRGGGRVKAATPLEGAPMTNVPTAFESSPTIIGKDPAEIALRLFCRKKECEKMLRLALDFCQMGNCGADLESLHFGLETCEIDAFA